jgi:ribosomal protein S18 acetylase RimI-like enzyme
MPAITIRAARSDEGLVTLPFFRAATNGLSDYFANKLKDEDETADQFMARFFAKPDEDYGFSNTWMAVAGSAVIGVMNGVQVPDDYDGGELLEDPVLGPIWELEMPNTWCMQILAVDPTSRGLGIGTRLIQLAESEARRHGLSRLSLTVHENSEAARRLYKQVGFVETDRRKLVSAPPYFEVRGDLIQMAKDL